MPYIDKETRALLNSEIAQLSEKLHNLGDVGGHLNYVISALVDDYIAVVGKRYANLERAVGTLECAKLEIYRRLAAPYEDAARDRNGEVFGLYPSREDEV